MRTTSSFSASMEGKGASTLTGRGVSTAQLAETLSATLGTVVLDQTGMTGNYYFGFKFLSVQNNPSDEVEGSTIFSALQDELGLRLEKQKASVEILVIDHFVLKTDDITQNDPSLKRDVPGGPDRDIKVVMLRYGSRAPKQHTLRAAGHRDGSVR